MCMVCCGVVVLCHLHWSSAKEMLLCKRCGVTKPRQEFEQKNLDQKVMTACRTCLFPKCASCGSQSKNRRTSAGKSDWYRVLDKNNKKVDPRKRRQDRSKNRGKARNRVLDHGDGPKPDSVYHTYLLVLCKKSMSERGDGPEMWWMQANEASPWIWLPRR